MKAFTTGLQLHSSGQPEKAIAHLERAVALDSEFALAYAQIGTAYYNLRDPYQSRVFTAKAYALRERASDRERFYIEARYHDALTGDLEQAVRVYELWARTYPRDSTPWNNIGVTHESLGEFEKALASYSEAVKLDPQNGLLQDNLASIYVRLDRMDEAKAASDAVIARYPNMGDTRFAVACRERETARMSELLTHGRAQNVSRVLAVAFQCALRDGRFAEARKLRTEGVPGRGLVELALAEWRLGDRTRAKAMAAEAAQMQPEAAQPIRLAPLLAEIGEVEQARRLIARRVADQPRDTLINGVWAPLTTATLSIVENKPELAIAALASAERLQRRWPEIALRRGLAYERRGNTAAAIAEFKRLTDTEPAWPPAATVYPAAMLALARAQVAAGDSAAGRKAYQRFLDLWKDADSDLTALLEARRELAALR